MAKDDSGDDKKIGFSQASRSFSMCRHFMRLLGILFWADYDISNSKNYSDLSELRGVLLIELKV